MPSETWGLFKMGVGKDSISLVSKCCLERGFRVPEVWDHLKWGTLFTAISLLEGYLLTPTKKISFTTSGS